MFGAAIGHSAPALHGIAQAMEPTAPRRVVLSPAHAPRLITRGLPDRVRPVRIVHPDRIVPPVRIAHPGLLVPKGELIPRGGVAVDTEVGTELV